MIELIPEVLMKKKLSFVTNTVLESQTWDSDLDRFLEQNQI